MTPAQLQTLRDDIANSPDLVGKQDYEISALYNADAAPTYLVWRTDASTDAVMDAIDWTKYTPNMRPQLADTPARAAFILNLLGNINIKQMNLQNMLFGRATVDATKAGIRKGLQDAVTAVPAGAAGAEIDPGGALGATVLLTMTRPARRIEKLLVTSTPTTGGVQAGVMGFQGTVSPQDISDVLAMP